MVKRERIKNRFKAKSESGMEYIILEFLEISTEMDYIDDPNEEMQGIKRFVTSDGLAVDYLDPNTFQIVDSGEILRKS